MKKIHLLLFLFTISTLLVSAQNLKRANILFEKRAYLDAAKLFLNEKDKTQEIYEKLGDCYYFNTKMDQAVQWYKKLILNYEENINPTYFYKYSQALKGIKDYKEADKWFNKYVAKKQLTPIEKRETIPYFKALNSKIKRPYSVHKLAINSKGSDFGTTIYKDNVIFSSTRTVGELYSWNKQPYLDLYQATSDSIGNLSNVIPFSTSLNTKMHESNAIFSNDGNTMYFTRNNFVKGKKRRDAKKVTRLKIYKAQLVNNKWVNIEELPFNSDDYSVEHPALSANEKQLYFASDMPGTIGSLDIFVVDINIDGSYGLPKNLGPVINTEYREQFPFISSDNTLYFASDGHFGLGGLDIFKSKITQGSFSKPVNLSNPINSNLDDFAFVINEKHKTGYFSSNRKGGVGDDDIYRFTQKKIFYVKGLAQDKNSLELLPGTLVTLLNENNSNVKDTIVGEDAAFSFEIEPNKAYKIRGTRKLYNPNEVTFVTDNNGNINKNIQLLLELYENAEKEIIVENGKTQIKINPIYFDFDKWYIRPDAATDLNNVVNIMKKYPEMVIEIGAHTDCRGSENYNYILSEKRAKSVLEYLISNGISPNNVKSVGYGETQPINHCIKEGICTEEEYDVNRRCEFVIVN